MRQIQPEPGESLVFFFLTLIQLYLLHSFLYFLTYCIKEVIKGNIFWRLNEKNAGLWGSYGLKQRNPLNFFSKHWSNWFFLFLYFWLTVSKRVSTSICLDITFKSVDVLGSCGLKKGNSMQNLKFSNKIISGST